MSSDTTSMSISPGMSKMEAFASLFNHAKNAKSVEEGWNRPPNNDDIRSYDEAARVFMKYCPNNVCGLVRGRYLVNVDFRPFPTITSHANGPWNTYDHYNGMNAMQNAIHVKPTRFAQDSVDVWKKGSGCDFFTEAVRQRVAPHEAEEFKEEFRICAKRAAASREAAKVLEWEKALTDVTKCTASYTTISRSPGFHAHIPWNNLPCSEACEDLGMPLDKGEVRHAKNFQIDVETSHGQTGRSLQGFSISAEDACQILSTATKRPQDDPSDLQERAYMPDLWELLS